MAKAGIDKNNETGVKKGQKFSDRYLTSLKPKLNPVATDYILREGHGFALRVFPNKVKKFYYIYDLVPKKQKKLCLGTYISEEDVKDIPIEDRVPYVTLKEARERYNKYSAQVLSGVDPMAPAEPEPVKPETYTVKMLMEDYIKNCRINKHTDKTIYDVERALAKDVIPVIGNRAVDSIRKSDAVGIVQTVAARAPGQGRNVMKASRAMFNFAVELEKHEFNPFSKAQKIVSVIAPNERQRTLTDDEIKHLWRELYNREDGPGVVGTKESRAAILLTLVTAQRPGEICGMSASEVNGDWITIDVSRIKTRRKNPCDHRVYLTPLAKWLLPELTGDWYFPYPDAKARRLERTGPILENSLSKLFSRQRKNKSGELTVPLYLGLPQWQPHDLRRTAVTGLSKLGCPDTIIKAIINHKKSGAIGIYNRNEYDNEKEFWLTQWSDYLQNLVSTTR